MNSLNILTHEELFDSLTTNLFKNIPNDVSFCPDSSLNDFLTKRNLSTRNGLFINVGMGYALDFYSIAQVKYEFVPSEINFDNFHLYSSVLEFQLGKDLFGKIKSSKEFEDLLETNRFLFKKVDVAKQNLVRASYIDYLNWVRFIHKQDIEEKFLKSDNSERKEGYEGFKFLRMKDSPMLILLDEEFYNKFKDVELVSNGSGYACYRRQTIHRLVLEDLGYDIQDKMVDHINGNIWDNREQNLRPATRAQNNANRPAPRNNKSGYKGVRADNKNPNLWICAIKIDKKTKYVATFKEKIHAAIAYDIYMKKHFGDYAYLNIPNPDQKDYEFVLEALANDNFTIKNKSSQYYGVHFCKSIKKWISRLHINKKMCIIGGYDNEKDAALAVDEKLKEIGRVNKLNFKHSNE